MKIIQFLFFSFLITFTSDFCQIPQTTGERFNERGFFNSSSSRFDGNEIIGDYDGNLNIVYSRSYDLPNDLGGDLTLTWNPNVEHRVFTNCPNSPSPSGLPVNAPEWILGYKGFALQTLNFETFFYVNKTPSNICNTLNLTGEQVPLLIPGYNFTNTLKFGIPQGSNNDVIEILMADGSKKQLFNKDVDTDVGTYIEGGSENLGYAFVYKYYSSGGDYLRKMYYKPGDGLTYFFREENVKYKYDIEMIHKPKVFYLERIISQAGDVLTLFYNYSLGNKEYYGRKVFLGMHCNNTPYKGVLDVGYLTVPGMVWGTTQEYLRGIELTNEWKNNTKITVALKSSVVWPSLDRRTGLYDTKIYKVEKIIDEMGRSDVFHYSPTYKSFQDKGGNPGLSFKVPLYLINSVTYDEGKRSDFEYYDHRPNEIYSFDAIPSINISSTCRDVTTNFTISSKKIFKKENDGFVPLSEDRYSYSWPGKNDYQNYLDEALDIRTEIVKSSLSGYDTSCTNSVKIIKSFNKYKTAARSTLRSDNSSSIKLMSENMEWTDNQNNKITKTKYYNYDLGELNPYWTGSFDLLSEIEVDSTQNGRIARVTQHRNQYQNFVIGPNYYWFKKRIKTCDSTFTPDGNVTVTRYNTEYCLPPINPNDTLEYFNRGLISEKTIASGGIIKSRNEYIYFPNRDFCLYGKLYWEINKTDPLRPIYKEYDYMNPGIKMFKGTYLYKGFLKSINIDGKMKLEYDYLRIDSVLVDKGGRRSDGVFFPPLYKFFFNDSINCKKLYTDGTVEPFTINPHYYWSKPYRTKLIFKNANGLMDTLSTHSLDENFENKTHEVNANGYLLESYYDNSGRTTNVALPGSFPKTEQIKVDTTFQRINKDERARSGMTYKWDPFPWLPMEIITGNVITDGYEYEFDGAICPDCVIPAQYDTLRDYSYGWSGKFSGTVVSDTLETKIENIFKVNSASMIIYTDKIASTPDQDRVIFVYGRSSQGAPVGQIRFSFIPYSTITLDIAPILNKARELNTDIAGFVFTSEAKPSDYPRSKKEFHFKYIKYHMLDYDATVMKIDTIKGTYTASCKYDDLNRKVTINKIMDYQNPIKRSTVTEQYDALGQLTKVYVYNSANNFVELKSETEYNYLGLKKRDKDAEGRIISYKYDYFSRPIETKYGYYSSPVASKFDYGYASFSGEKVDKTLVTDEENNSVLSYYDKGGRILANTKYPSVGTAYTTNYMYDEAGRLKQVITAEGKKTNYYYNANSNIIARKTPNDSTNFKYDKYGNVRFSWKKGRNNFSFTQYDVLNRPVVVGLKDVSMYATVNPDVIYNSEESNQTNNSIQLNNNLNYVSMDNTAIVPNAGTVVIYDPLRFEHLEQDTMNFTIVNMYDKLYNYSVFRNMPFNSGSQVKNTKGKIVATAFRDSLAQSWSYKVYSYDAMGRINTYWIKYKNQEWKTVKNTYDVLGNLTSQNINNQFFVWYTYDSQGRLTESRSNTSNNFASATIDASYDYTLTNQVNSINLGKWKNVPVNSLKYKYDSNRGWLTGINDVNQLFSESLDYYRNGNVRNQQITNKENGNSTEKSLSFRYYYDGLNRLRFTVDKTTDSTKGYYEAFSYSKDGNITLRTVPGKQYSYYYPLGSDLLGNVRTVDSETSNILGYKYYYYSPDGNFTSKKENNISMLSINKYDYRNLPLTVNVKGELNNYYYDDSGNRIAKVGLNNKEFYLRDHTGREIAVYDLTTNKIKFVNLYGNGLIGRAELF